MKPERKEVALSDEAKMIFKIVKDYKKVDLKWLKEEVGLSNKKWDKSLKELNSKALTGIHKLPDGTFQVWLE
jgi:lysyl-tRNA synthetase class 2